MKSDKTIEKLSECVIKLENYKPCQHDIDWCADTASWLYRFNPKLRKDLIPIIENITNIYERR